MKWHKGKLILLSVFILFNTITHGQVRISGIVKDSAGKALAGVSVTLFKEQESKVIRFAITDAKGGFSIPSPAGTDTLHVAVSMLGYDKQIIAWVPGKDATVSFTLVNKPVTLKEVTVNKPPLTQKKDTIEYDATAFKQPQDRMIGEVIARLPGIEVAPGGQIKYNGKPINKFYIEGLDLLEDRYGIATNNLPADMVEKIQVLENHQPVRLLDSIVSTNRAALNIKLKDNSKAKIAGKVKLGIGAAPLLSEDELSVMLFKKNLQFLNTYKFNNTGLNNARELNAQNIGEYLEAIENGAVKNDLLAVVQPANPNISENRYLFNSAHTASINQLLPVGANYQLRLNASYVNDHRRLQSNTVTKVYLPFDTVTINELNLFAANNNTLQTDFTLMANTPKYYLKNNLQFQGSWMQEANNLHAKTQVDQRLANPFYKVLNDLKLMWARRKHILQLRSYTGFVSMPQHLHIYPGLYENVLHDSIAFDKLLQSASLKVFYTDNYFGFSSRFARFTVDHKIGFNIQVQQYLSSLVIEQQGVKSMAADSFQNDLDWKRNRFYFHNALTYEYNRVKLRLSLPFNLVSFTGTDPGKQLDYRESFFTLNPAVNFVWHLHAQWEINSHFTHSYNFGDYSNMARGYVLRTYRNLGNNKSPLAEYRNTELSGTITFRDPVKIFFLHNGVRFAWNRSNLLYSQAFNGSLETLIALLQNNNRYTNNVFGRFNKYFIPAKTSIILHYNYMWGKRQLLQQQIMSSLSNKSYSIGLDAKTKISNKLTADYSTNYFKYFTSSQHGRGNTLAAYSQNLVLNYFPAERLLIKGVGEHYYLGSDLFPYKNYFFTDIAFRYTTKSKVDFELLCQNILNAQTFVSGFLADNIETVTSYQLRPRQVIVKAIFSL